MSPRPGFSGCCVDAATLGRPATSPDDGRRWSTLAQTVFSQGVGPFDANEPWLNDRVACANNESAGVTCRYTLY